jgi:hypothetical protein
VLPFADIAVVDMEEVKAAVAEAERVHRLLVFGPGEGPVLAWPAGRDRLRERCDSSM